MKIKLFFVVFALIVSTGMAAKTVIFESTLKDAVFCPLYISAGSAVLDRQMERDFPMAGWWTLKFENGAVITSYRIPGDFASVEIYKKAGIKRPGRGIDIWWIGKVYIVSQDEDRPDYFIVKLKEESKEEK